WDRREVKRFLNRFMTPLRSKSNLQNTAETPLVTVLNPQRHSWRGGSAAHIVVGCKRKGRARDASFSFRSVYRRLVLSPGVPPAARTKKWAHRHGTGTGRRGPPSPFPQAVVYVK